MSGFEFLMQYQSDYEVAKQTDEEPAAKHQGSPAILRDRKQSNDNSKSGAGQRRDQLCNRKIDASEKRSKEQHIPNPVLALPGRKWPAAVYQSATQGENNGEQPPEGDAQAFGLFNEEPAEDSRSGVAGKSNGHQKSQPRNHERVHHTQALGQVSYCLQRLPSAPYRLPTPANRTSHRTCSA